MVAYAYCMETGRPFVDRLQLLDFTSTKKSDGHIHWVNVRLRWGDLRITEQGRVPKRGEALVLFVLQGSGAPKAEWLSNGRRSVPKAKGKPKAVSKGDKVTWQVTSLRVLRNLPFQEQVSTVLLANVGVQLLHYALQFVPPRRCSHMVYPPSWSAGAQLQSASSSYNSL